MGYQEHERALECCDPVAEEMLVDVCLRGMMEVCLCRYGRTLRSQNESLTSLGPHPPVFSTLEQLKIKEKKKFHQEENLFKKIHLGVGRTSYIIWHFVGSDPLLGYELRGFE